MFTISVANYNLDRWQIIKRSNLSWTEIDNLPLYEYIEIRQFVEKEIEEERKRAQEQQQQQQQILANSKNNKHRPKFKGRKK